MNELDPGSTMSMAIRDVVKWRRENRLLLPPIQRRAVWKNDQIINYWDSLVRGYPAGLMFVHRSASAGSEGRNEAGMTISADPDDYYLFDGQQRLASIMLGLGGGPHKDRLRLWVDLGHPDSSRSDLLYTLRVSSAGQPFGYQPASPNAKFGVDERRKKIQSWKTRHRGQFDPAAAFAEAQGEDLIEADKAVPLAKIFSLLESLGLEKAVGALAAENQLPTERVRRALSAFQGALDRPILFQEIPPQVVGNEHEYVRFFTRLGQGGTALSNDELTYSIIKHKYPKVHDRMDEIMRGSAGRLAGEVNLVLAALRLAKVGSPWENAKMPEIVSRPNPGFVAQLQYRPTVESAFLELIPRESGGHLKALLERLRQRLEYDQVHNPAGIPTMLLGSLPHQLVDVLLLMQSKEATSAPLSGEGDLLAAFSLYWLLFVSHEDNAARLVYEREHGSEPIVGEQALRALALAFEQEGAARRLPLQAQLTAVRRDIEHVGPGDHKLRGWDQRFRVLDEDEDDRRADALRVLSMDSTRIRRALLWLQRSYVAAYAPGFDFTSSRDDDLPVDLDHLIPRHKFGDDWRPLSRKLAFDDVDNFRRLRKTVGNTLGNYRWLGAAENRSRRDGSLEPLPDGSDRIRSVDEWNRVIHAPSWSHRDVAAFQRLIDLRSVDLYEALLVEGGLDVFALEPT